MGKPLKTLGRTLRIPYNRRFAFQRLREYHSQPRSLVETVDWAMNFGGGGYLKVKTLQIPWGDYRTSARSAGTQTQDHTRNWYRLWWHLAYLDQPRQRESHHLRPTRHANTSTVVPGISTTRVYV